jgi:hypothetical protein
MYESTHAGVAQSVEHQLPKLRVASSNLVARSNHLVESPDLFRLDLSDPDLIRLVRAAGHHLRPLQAYLGGLPVLEEHQVSPAHNRQIEAAERFLQDPISRTGLRPIPVPGLTGLEVVGSDLPHRNLLLRREGVVLGGIRSGLPLVSEMWRGRGLGVLLVLISDIEGGRFLRPVAYSVSGAGARRAAHTLQVRIGAGAQKAPADQGSGVALTLTQTKL